MWGLKPLLKAWKIGGRDHGSDRGCKLSFMFSRALSSWLPKESQNWKLQFSASVACLTQEKGVNVYRVQQPPWKYDGNMPNFIISLLQKLFSQPWKLSCILHITIFKATLTIKGRRKWSRVQLVACQLGIKDSCVLLNWLINIIPIY